MRIGPLLAHLRELEAGYADALRAAAERHRDDHDVFHQCQTFATTVDKRLQKLEPVGQRYGGEPEWQSAVESESADLLEDLRALYLRAQEVAITWVMASQAAKGARDQELLTLSTECQTEVETHAKWLTTRIKTGAPQSLVVG